jgi:hypothetical protein
MADEPKPAPTIDNPPIPDPHELLRTGKGRWRDFDVELTAEAVSAYDRKHGFHKIPEATWDYDGEPKPFDEIDPAYKARLQFEGTATLRRIGAWREEQERARRREAAREILRKRGLLK